MDRVAVSVQRDPHPPPPPPLRAGQESECAWHTVVIKHIELSYSIYIIVFMRGLAFSQHRRYVRITAQNSLRSWLSGRWLVELRDAVC